MVSLASIAWAQGHGPVVPEGLSRSPAQISRPDPAASPAIDAAPAQPDPSAAEPEQAASAPAPGALVPSGSLPIGTPRADTGGLSSADSESETSVFSIPKGMARTAMALGGVLALIFVLAHVFKKASGASGSIASKLGAGGDAPSGIVEVLGRYPLSRGQSLVVMRFGRRILLLSSERGAKKGGGTSMHTLCELTDPDEVAHIRSLIGDARGESHNAQFEQAIHEAGNATDNAIAALMQAQQRNAPTPRVGAGTRRRAPGVLSNSEGDRLELTGALASPAAGGVMKRRIGSLRRAKVGG